MSKDDCIGSSTVQNRGMNSEFLRQVDAFADAAHRSVNQVRKYTGEAYIVHPREVAAMVAETGAEEEVIAAALLHDVVEDTPVTNEEIESRFGRSVARLVAEVTDVSTPADGNRAARKALDRAHLAAASGAGQTIKLADLISNSRSILTHDRNFARVYLREKALLLSVLTRGDRRLHEVATAIVDRATAEFRGEIAV